MLRFGLLLPPSILAGAVLKESAGRPSEAPELAPDLGQGIKLNDPSMIAEAVNQVNI